jgi:hypothetical protein
MVSKCANPDCSATFRYFHVGKLFRLETAAGLDRRHSLDDDEGVASKPMRRIMFYWLCENCDAKMTLAFDRHTGVCVRPKIHAQSAAA